MAAENFYLKPEALGSVSGPSPDADRQARWRSEFPDADAGLVAKTARLFPATEPGVFRRWLKLRSAVPAAAEAAEAVLRDEPDRPTIFPLKDKPMWDFRKKIEKVHWIAEEVDLSRDRDDLARVDAAEKRLLEDTLGFFGVADEMVMAGIDDVISGLVRQKEGAYYLKAQNDQECVHSESYSLQIEAIVPAARRDAVFNAVKTNPVVARMVDWVRWWILADHPAADVFAMMAFLEGVLFSGFFATLQHFKSKNLFPGVTQLNEFISRDEGIHSEFWCFVVSSRLDARPEKRVVHGIARETVALSDAFFANAIPEGVVGLNAGLLGQYVRSIADSVLAKMDAGAEPRAESYAGLYGAENPLDFMDNLLLNQVGKTNFFEGRPTAYQAIGDPEWMAFEVNTTPVETVA